MSESQDLAFLDASSVEDDDPGMALVGRAIANMERGQFRAAVTNLIAGAQEIANEKNVDFWGIVHDDTPWGSVVGIGSTADNEVSNTEG